MPSGPITFELDPQNPEGKHIGSAVCVMVTSYPSFERAGLPVVRVGPAKQPTGGVKIVVRGAFVVGRSERSTPGYEKLVAIQEESEKRLLGKMIRSLIAWAFLSSLHISRQYYSELYTAYAQQLLVDEHVAPALVIRLHTLSAQGKLELWHCMSAMP